MYVAHRPAPPTIPVTQSSGDQANSVTNTVAISAAVVLVAVILAFGSFVRFIIWSGSKEWTTRLIIVTRLYRWWLNREINPSDITQKTENRILKMKDVVRER